MEVRGSHKNTKYIGIGINGRHMITCRDCNTTTHSWQMETAELQMISNLCIPDCENCKSIRRSYDGKPAVPIGGNCNTKFHTCPNDGKRWWQSNTYYHLWQQVTDDNEWQAINSSTK